MKRIKQVSDLTGISVRMLHHYDKIGLLKPSKLTAAGYRLYDDKALQTLQQILFFRELDLPLKEIKKIISDPNFDKMEALKSQQKLLILKRKKLDDLIELINKTLKGETTMSFKEFDMSEYFNALETYKKEHEDKVIQYYGSIDNYNELIRKCKIKENEIAKIAIQKYGSIKKYVNAMMKNLNSDYLETAEKSNLFREDFLKDNHPKLKKLWKKLISYLGKEPSAPEVQAIAAEITKTAKADYEVFKIESGDYFWYYKVQSFSILPDFKKEVDAKYGNGASNFIYESLNYYLGDNQPKLITLYTNLTSDLTKNPHSQEIQAIVKKIAAESQKLNESLQVEEGENSLAYTAQQYLSESALITVTDKKYGVGASHFIGEALKFFSEQL